MDYNSLASADTLEKTTAALAANGFMPITVATKEEALAKIRELIPEGSSIMNGASESLHQIGYIDVLKSKDHKWNNLHDRILEETDPEKQALLRKQQVLSDFYLGSAHAVTETGEIMIASNTGSQLPHLAYTSPNVILVVSAKKIVPTLADAFARIDQHVVPLEDVRMKKVYGYGTMHSKTLILHKENAAMGRKVHVMFVNEDLGF